MRVCLVSAEVAPFVGGGLAVYVLELSRALRDAGHDVHVLTRPTPGLRAQTDSLYPGVTFHEAALDSGKAAIPGAYYCESSRVSMAFLEALRVMHVATPFDYIEFPEYMGHGYWPIRAKRTLGDFAGAVLGVRLHMPHYVCREYDRTAELPLEFAHVAHMEVWSAGEADLVIAASEAMLKRMRRDVQAASPRAEMPPMHLVRLPLRLDDMHREREPAADVPEVLCFGRLQGFKGTDVFVEAAVRLLDVGTKATFRLIGGDTQTGPFGRSMREHLEKRIPERWKGRVVIEGPRARAGVHEAVRRATVCVFPSRFETFCYAAVEAMSLGACVVVSDGGSLPEIVRDGVDGIVTRAGNAASLADGISRALADDGLRARLSAAAPARAREVSRPTEIVAEMERLIAGVKARAVPPLPPAVVPPAREITVIVPCFNVGRYLPETLDSLRRQTYTNFDVLIIDDGTTEVASLAVFDRLRTAGYTILRKPNGGLGSARNHGFKDAKTTWVIPIDGDDVAHPRFIERLYEAIRRDPTLDAASCMFESFRGEPGDVVSGYVPMAIDRDLLTFHNVAGPGAASILRRQAVLDAGGYDEYLTSFEDWDLWCTFAARGLRGVAIPEFLLHYRLRDESLIHAEATPRLHALKAYLLAKHAKMARDPSVPLRVQLAEAMGEKARADERAAEVERLRAELAGRRPDALRGEVRRTVQENLRYRVADRVSEVLAKVGLKRAAKALMMMWRG